jgi:hypothetical protein
MDMRRTIVSTGFLALALAATGLSPWPAQKVQAETAATAQLQELPSVADLADRLLPAVVEITIEAKGSAVR